MGWHTTYSTAFVACRMKETHLLCFLLRQFFHTIYIISLNILSNTFSAEIRDMFLIIVKNTDYDCVATIVLYFHAKSNPLWAYDGLAWLSYSIMPYIKCLYLHLFKLHKTMLYESRIQVLKKNSVTIYTL